MNICVVIPSHNESCTISGLIKDIAAHQLPVIVVDDGSTDSTVECARSAGALTLSNERNMGKGASLVKGFDFAVEKGYDAVLTMDGDGQHLPSDIPFFLDAAQKQSAASKTFGIIIGNRMTKVGNMPFARVLTNRFMSWLISRICRQNIPDSQCGFRLINSAILRAVKLHTRKFEAESEILIKTARLGYTISSVPIKTIYEKEASHINPFVDTLRFIRFLVKHGKTKQ